MFEEATPRAGAAVPPGRSIRPRHWLALAAILLWHGGLAVWMAVAHPGPTHYFYDEKFNMENVQHILATGKVEPANGWYSMASYLPQAGLLATVQAARGWVGAAPLALWDGQGQALAPSFLSSRLLNIVYGSVSLWLVFVIGRRLAGNGAGLLGALCLAASPWQIRTSVEFKPDGLLLLATLLAFLLVLRLIERPTTRNAAWAGVGYGLGVGVKLNGLFFGLTIAAATAVAATIAVRREGGLTGRAFARRVISWGVVEIGLAGIVFLAATPYLQVMWHYLSRMDRFYGQKGGATTPWQMVASAAADLWTPYFLGPAICVLAVAGGVLAVAGLKTQDAEPSRRWGTFLLLFFPFTYLAAVALQMRYYKGNNMVQMLPFLALLAALALVELGSRLPASARRPLAIAGVAALALHAGWQSGSFSYAEHVPTGLERLVERMRFRMPLDVPRIVIFEGSYEEMPLYDAPREGNWRSVSAVRWVEDIAQVPRAELDLADAVIARADHPGADRAAWLAALSSAAPPAGRHALLSEPFVQRGPGYVLLEHVWSLRDTAELACRPTEDAARFACPLPGEWPAGDIATVTLAFPHKRIGAAEIAIGDQRVEPLLAATLDRPGGGWEAISERFVIPAAGAELRVRFEQPISGALAEAGIRLGLARWQPPPPSPGRRQELPERAIDRVRGRC
jgi:hypothetical protein